MMADCDERECAHFQNLFFYFMFMSGKASDMQHRNGVLDTICFSFTKCTFKYHDLAYHSERVLLVDLQ